MTDLEINIALAKAMGWVEFEWEEWVDLAGNGFITNDGQVLCSYKNSAIIYKFDYRDPVIFVAVCKHWGLVVNFSDGYASGIDKINIVGEWEKPRFIEKAVALVVIELAKRGVK
jgi:hypothetical protein